MIGTYVDAMFIASTAFLVQSASGRVVILAYRGTQPTGLISWLADADLARSKIALTVGGEPCDVHGGFYRNTRATRYKITEALLRAKQGLPITAPKGTTHPGPKTPALQPMEALYITGHSLGGAIAAIHTILLMTDDNQHAALGDVHKATYTFGQPMVGSPELAQGCDAIAALRDNVVRFVYRKDPVPHVPRETPVPSRTSAASTPSTGVPGRRA
ncbi:lipase family protein [Streptacidiphilus monticola]